MYIPVFWCGFAAGVLTMLAAVILIAMFAPSIKLKENAK